MKTLGLHPILSFLFFILVAWMQLGCVDRGRCILSHQKLVPMWIQLVPDGNGGLITIIHPEYVATKCDQWEFPNGK